MSSQPLNLVERATERLRQSGAIDAATAQLLEVDPRPAERSGERVADGGPDGAPDRVPGALNGASPGALNGTSHGASGVALGAPGGQLWKKPPTLDASILERASLIQWSKGRTRVSEEFRIIQSQIMRTAFAPETAGHGLANLVMVTSSRPGEGKSFAALNLALSIARQHDHDVLLVDTDAKEQSVGALLGVEGAPGLLDLALDPQLKPGDLMVTTGFDKLSVLPLGSQPGKSAELFATRQMARLIRDLGRRYADRVVILDAAPCLSSSDPSSLAPIVGQIVLVVEAERTQRSELESALDLVQACPAISLLLNKVQVTSSHTFGAYASPYIAS